MTKTKKNYVNNAKFFEELVKYKEKQRLAKEQGLQDPPIPDYIGECIWQIATKLSFKFNFTRYTFREELVGDGIECAIRYMDNFDPNKTQNPFAYFTQIIYYAFLRRIATEKKQLYIKHKVLERHMLTSVTSDINDGELNDGSAVNLNTDYMNNFVEDFEKKMEEKKAKTKKQASLESLIEE